MMAQLIDRKQLKQQTRETLRDAQVSPKAMVALYLGIVLALDLADVAAGGSLLQGGTLPGTFVSVLTGLVATVLSAGFTLYCMAVRRGERAEFLTLFDGFSFVGKIIGLNIVIYLFTLLWAMLFLIPGLIAAYRYRFALYNLYENPDLGILEALDMSKRQTQGYKSQLLMLDLSYFGWGVLASIPALVLEWAVSYQTMESAFSVALPVPALVLGALALSSLVWMLIIDLWSLAVSLFYLAPYQCTELGYFEIAKETSGVGAGVSPQEPRWNDNGPDGLGGL